MERELLAEDARKPEGKITNPLEIDDDGPAESAAGRLSHVGRAVDLVMQTQHIPELNAWQFVGHVVAAMPVKDPDDDTIGKLFDLYDFLVEK